MFASHCRGLNGWAHNHHSPAARAFFSSPPSHQRDEFAPPHGLPSPKKLFSNIDITHRDRMDIRHKQDCHR
jgi:hypothetical protein